MYRFGISLMTIAAALMALAASAFAQGPPPPMLPSACTFGFTVSGNQGFRYSCTSQPATCPAPYFVAGGFRVDRSGRFVYDCRRRGGPTPVFPGCAVGFARITAGLNFSCVSGPAACNPFFSGVFTPFARHYDAATRRFTYQCVQF